MSDGRIWQHPILGNLEKRAAVTFQFDDQLIQGYEGETIAASLLANGVRTLRYHESSGSPRGIYCNIGHCFECRVSVDGIDGIRACLTPIASGMRVKSGKKLPSPLKKGDSHL